MSISLFGGTAQAVPPDHGSGSRIVGVHDRGNYRDQARGGIACERSAHRSIDIPTLTADSRQ
jgi:hypothetical protein